MRNMSMTNSWEARLSVREPMRREFWEAKRCKVQKLLEENLKRELKDNFAITNSKLKVDLYMRIRCEWTMRRVNVNWRRVVSSKRNDYSSHCWIIMARVNGSRYRSDYQSDLDIPEFEAGTWRSDSTARDVGTVPNVWISEPNIDFMREWRDGVGESSRLPSCIELGQIRIFYTWETWDFEMEVMSD